MNTLAPRSRASFTTRPCNSASHRYRTTAPRWSVTAGRGRSYGNASSSGRPRSSRRQNAVCRAITSLPDASASRCHSAKSAYCTGNARQSGAPPLLRASYAVTTSRHNGASDQPSAAMWCTTTTSSDSPPGPRNSSARKGGSRVRSKAYRTDRTTSAASAAGWPAGVTVRYGRSASWSRTTWYGSPSAASANTVRNASCRPTTSPSASFSAPESTAPRSRSTNGTLYAAPGPSSRCRNHRRRCAGDSGSRAGRSVRTTAGRAAAAPPTRRARAAGVRASNRARRVSSRPSAARARLTSRVARRE